MQLDFDRPELWWPNGLGAPALYDLSLDLVLDGYGDSDASEVRFGFRHVTSYIDPELQGRRFEVNGRPVFIRGGNWIVSDAMLRLSKERYEVEASCEIVAFGYFSCSGTGGGCPIWQ